MNKKYKRYYIVTYYDESSFEDFIVFENKKSAIEFCLKNKGKFFVSYHIESNSLKKLFQK